MLDIGLVPIAAIPLVAQDVTAVLEEYGKEWLKEVEVQDIFRKVILEEMDLWLATADEQLEIVGFCCWEKHAKLRNYHIMWLGGRGLRKYLKAGLDKVENYACMHGARELILGGRKEWLGVLKPYGYLPPAERIELRKNVQLRWSN